MADESKTFAVSGAPPLPLNAATLPPTAPPLPGATGVGGGVADAHGTTQPRMIVKPIDDAARQVMKKLFFPQTIAVMIAIFLLILLLALVFPMSLSYTRAVLVLVGVWTSITAWRVNQALPGGYTIWKPFSPTGSMARLMFFVGFSVLLPQLPFAIKLNDADHHGKYVTQYREKANPDDFDKRNLKDEEEIQAEALGGVRSWLTAYMVVVLPFAAYALLKSSEIAGVPVGSPFHKRS